MSKVNIGDLKKIREMTGASVDAIRRALEEADGKIEKVLELLKKRGESVAAKKAGRETSEGLVSSYIHSNGKIGVLVKVLCETDFVARNELFKQLGHEIAMHIAAANPQSVEELITQAYIRDPDITINDLVQSYIAKLGENLKINEFCRFEI